MTTRRWIGLFLLALGVGYLLDALGVWDFGVVFRTYWPSAVVLFGLVQLVTRPASRGLSLILIAVGLYLQVDALHLLGVDVGRLFWAAVLVVAGLWLLAGRGGSRRWAGLALDTVDLIGFFGSTETPILSQAFRGGSVTAIFGGSVLDLRRARLAAEGAEMDLVAVFGRVRLLVPESWRVVADGLQVFGGWRNETRLADQPGTAGATLRVTCFPVFGRIVIQN
ncbi:MAG: DUF5668 domain-containing protein [Bacillota bacterium]|nr:DUF5668 domain-containing protein [Bacillota bacterium]